MWTGLERREMWNGVGGNVVKFGEVSLFKFTGNLEIDLFLRHKRISHGPEKITDRCT